MKKSILNLGKILNKAELQSVSAGSRPPIGDADGECNQESQAKIRCYPGNNSNCNMDAICNYDGYCECVI